MCCIKLSIEHGRAYRATKSDVIRPPAKANNRASDSKQLEYTAVSYELHAVGETIILQCSAIYPKDQYTFMTLGGIPFNILNIMSVDFS